MSTLFKIRSAAVSPFVLCSSGNVKCFANSDNVAACVVFC